MKEKKERMKTNDACSETENELYSEQHRVHAETEYPVVFFPYQTVSMDMSRWKTTSQLFD